MNLNKYDILKLKAVALYIINKLDGIDLVGLFKILYFANTEHLAKYGSNIVNDTFCALDFGPVPSNLYDAIKVAQGKHQAANHKELAPIYDSITTGNDFADYVIFASEKADIDELSKSNIECIDESIATNANLSFKEISNKSHGSAWNTAREIRVNSPMDKLSMAKEAGADEAMLQYIMQNDEVENITRR